MTVYALARALRADFLRGEMEAQGRLVVAYSQAFDRAFREYEQLARQIAEAKRKGDKVTRSQLERLSRLESVKAQLAFAASKFASGATQTISAAQRSAIDQATSHARQLIGQGLQNLGEPQTFAYANLEAVQALVGHMGDGSPINQSIFNAAKGLADDAERILVEGVALGKNPRQLARELNESAGIVGSKAATIARTEILRAYNTATLENYRANDDVLDGWTWIAELDRRTCPVCWSLHGTVHPLDEDFGSHPNCRCTELPNIKGDRNSFATGEARFAKLPPETQEEILGPKTFQAYRDGKIGLGDLAGKREDAKWGTVRYRKSFKELGVTPADPSPKKRRTPVRLSPSTKPTVKTEALATPDLNGKYRKVDPKTSIDVIEGQIKSLPYEVAAVYRPDGRLAFAPKIGDENSVRFNAKELALMKDGVLTHNHPGGQPFSLADAQLASKHNLSAIRAVHTSGSFHMERPATGWPSPEKMAEADKEADRMAQLRARDKLIAIKNAGGQKPTVEGVQRMILEEAKTTQIDAYGAIGVTVRRETTP